MTNINIDVPEEIHIELKVRSVREKRDMKDIVVDLIQDYVKKGGKRK